jgi:cellulose synthase (UDP-forming)
VASYFSTQSVSVRSFRFVVGVASLFMLFEFVSLYLNWPKQIVLGGITIALALILNRATKSHVVTISLMLISLATTLRYGWWRIHLIVGYFSDESNNRLNMDSFLMLLLVSAEAYTILIMLLGYMQTVAPLRRKPIALPADESLWPHVDVLIPTYNEPLSLVRYTALAAINIDYPPEKLHVYILDDGTRADFKSFAEEAGVGYVTRVEHNHAKAGNINHALEKMNSPLVTIFDCDHVPTRSFLQVTVGWFLAEAKLAMLQTPHFFYSPDPFERNLLQYKTIPNEGELFYGVIQDGNDLWNATFFCGSCAVIRRSALIEVGGIATETVTEDAHTSLRMQKRGWNTAYINLPQAAGLATETLSAHVGQRIRWARGMIQIFRTDNPMLASGMKFTQRLCYFNAMLHFMYAIPRLVFLCAPLVYMVFGRTIIPGYWLAILAYAMPHLVLSSITNSRVQGKHRHSFWNEIYETVLAPYILMPTLLALINPKLGSFNVTDKGNTLSETRFDRHIAAPTTWLLAFNLVGICMVPYRLSVTDPQHPGTVISNLIWILFNMVILGVAGAVANEQKQRRTSVRIPAKIAVHLVLPDGQTITGFTSDMSVGGAALSSEQEHNLEIGTKVILSFPEQTGDATIGAIIVGHRHHEVRLQFDNLDIAQQETLTRALYSRANSWISSRANIEVDRPLLSLARVIRLSFTGFYQVLRGLVPRGKAAVLFFAVVLLASSTGTAQIPGAASVTAMPPSAPPNSSGTGNAPGATGAATLSVPMGAPKVMPPDVTSATADTTITFKDMGAQNGIELHGPHSFYSVGFVLPYDRLPRHAALELTYHFSASLLPHTGSIKLRLNGTPIGEISAPTHSQQGDGYAFLSLSIPVDLLIRDNNLTFEFTGGTLLPMESTAKTAVLASLGSTSRVLIASEPLALKRDLGLIPAPFFDSEIQSTTTIAFAFLSAPTTGTLQAAAVIASWFGLLSTSKPVHFRVTVGQIPPGNAVVFANRVEALPPSLRIPGGPSLSLQQNPLEPNGSLLVLAGEDDSQLLNVARSLALMQIAHPQPGEAVALFGNAVRIGEFPLPPPRSPDDAPRWLNTQKLTPLWSLSTPEAMISDGSRPIPIYFRVPPDLYYGETQNLNLKLTYRYNAAPLASGSALRSFLNGSLINETVLPRGTDFADKQRLVLLPVANMRPFGNTFLFNFDFTPASGSSDGQSADKLQGALLRDSWLDIRGLDHWAALPNLELFANAGFPFTRKADLSETTVVLPLRPSEKEIELLLYLMSHCGRQTGYPALRVEIDGPDAVMRRDRDYLMLGAFNDQPAFSTLEPALPVTFDGNGVHVSQATNYLATLRQLWRTWTGRTGQVPKPSNTAGVPDLMMEAIESPYYKGRSIVILSLRNDEAVDTFADAFLERSQSSDITHSVSLLRNAEFTSYDMEGPEYHVGYISSYSLLRIRLAEYFWLLLLVVIALSILQAGWIRQYLVWLAAKRISVDKVP